MDPRPIPARLEAVRGALRRRGLAALLVPSNDPHLSEYLPAHWQGRRWLSGFTGSMATLVVTLERAALFADSRYWVQAETELAGSTVELVKIGSAAAPAHVDWIVRHVGAGARVAVDGDVLALGAAAALRDRLGAAGIGLETGVDVLGEAWPDRPSLPQAPVYEHLPPHATETRAARLARVREAMRDAGATHQVLSTLDDIAWLLNLRGADVEFNPVFLAHLLLAADAATLFVDAGKVDPGLRERLAADGVELAPYEAAAAGFAALPAGATLLLDPKRVTLGMRERASAPVIERINPSTLMKSRKSAADAAHVRRAMAEDGAAMCEFYAWLEAALADPGREPITELTIDERLTAARARRPGYVGLSFATIAAFGLNGAMPHYRATPASHATIAGSGLLLIDSGAQYLGGTTDITRVWPIGRLSDAERQDYTRVLKGTLALSRTRFPRGTPGPMLDSIARAPLWDAGLDFGHGTGHGVGYFLNVHEGPQTISRSPADPSTAIEPGMITSIEPGVYRPGRWGIRIENLVLSVPAASLDGTFGEFLEFETLTLCPIDTRCIEHALLRPDEVAWLDDYHATVRERLVPLVDGAARDWLIERTRPIG
ncbi:aminopeptidase P family protein [Piscinibacter koreensis]|uniref:Aminopeptidase P family protein n=1 Tax=Piscinibacter koreensis TaxID=2742824 RepID=A0A7Y6NQ31_9BURK|nr:aminopeptidase P family protein [Schlegelella koreensis]NUZ07154.1 aminopeptidase P family protein [Schlegelella koreensis]